jgi:bifunctional non-homologous end joining protein LigD
VPDKDQLSPYRKKRSADATPEPAGEAAAAVEPFEPAATDAEPDASVPGGGVFCVQLHDATRLHYDLRLEIDGTLASWAVPKGPSLDPAEKRLAVHVEDHPLEYVDFEGVIPEGNYGAGAMILWDRGTWVARHDPSEGLETGKILLELRGLKLRGVWTLVKLAKSEKEWLLIREKRYVGSDEDLRDESLPAGSVLSGLTVDELAAGFDPAPSLRGELEESGARPRKLRTAEIDLMLGEARKKPFTRVGWIFELKLDGYRMLGGRSGEEVSLRTRNGHSAAGTFPEVAQAVAALPFDDFVLDGEIVAHDEEGLPSFQRLQKRAQLRRGPDIEAGALRMPATLYAFDLLALEGYDLRQLPLITRKAILRKILPQTGLIRYVDHFEERGEDVYEHVLRLELEGIVAKKADSSYRGGRSRHWLKVRADRSDDFVVVGFTPPKRGRTGFGAVHLAAYEAGELRYAGRVGGGFSDIQLAEVAEELAALERPEPAFLDAPATPGTGGRTSGKSGEHRWVEPELVVEVRYKERTEDGLLRQPVFLRLREDKAPVECKMPASRGRGLEAAEGSAEAAGEGRSNATPRSGDSGKGRSGAAAAPKLVLSNLEKVFWPEEAYTKGDLIEYYRAISAWLLPFLEGRPLVLTRYPDGIDGKNFYQKDAPDFAPDWIRTVGIWSDSSSRELEYFVCEDEASLLYLANLGTIPLHIWMSRVTELEHPDFCVLDLDPKEAPFEHVIEIALAIRSLCREIELPTFVKTSGSTGLHVLIPLGARYTYEQSRTLGQLLAQIIVRRLPAIATIQRNLAARQGRVYIDYLQNRRGQLIVAPYSVRPLPGAPVSAPLRWREVKPSLEISKHTVRTLPRRVRRMKDDPILPVLELRTDLAAVLLRLQESLVEE